MEKEPQYLVNVDPGDEQESGMDQMIRMAEVYQREAHRIAPDLPIPTTQVIFDRQTHYIQRRSMNRVTRSGK